MVCANNGQLVNKLRVKVPDPKLVTRYLIEIAKNYNVAWVADEAELEIDSSLMGDSTLDAEFSLPSPPKVCPRRLLSFSFFFLFLFFLFIFFFNKNHPGSTIEPGQGGRWRQQQWRRRWWWWRGSFELAGTTSVVWGACPIQECCILKLCELYVALASLLLSTVE